MTMLEKMTAVIEAKIRAAGPIWGYEAEDIARAALEAIREPSAVVEYAATGEGWNHVEGGFDALWQSAIDAILNEKTT
jgi:hypothetical protein